MIKHVRLICNIFQFVGFIALCMSIHELTPLKLKLIILGGIAPIVTSLLPNASLLNISAAVCGILTIGFTLARLK